MIEDEAMLILDYKCTNFARQEVTMSANVHALLLNPYFVIQKYCIGCDNPNKQNIDLFMAYKIDISYCVLCETCMGHSTLKANV